MAIAGALSGFAGVIQYTGNSNIMQIGVMPSQGPMNSSCITWSK